MACLAKATASLSGPEGYKARLFKTYEKSVKIGRNELMHPVFNKIQTNDVLLRFQYLQYSDVMPDIGDLHLVLGECFLLLNFFKSKSKHHQNLNKDDFISYAEKLCALVFKICEGELNSHHWKYVNRILACLSIVPGKSLKEINGFFKSRNSITYDNIKQGFEKFYN